MATLTNHAKLRAMFGGTLLKRATSIRVTGESGKVVVHTMDGPSTFSGFSSGEAVKSIEISYVIPISGPEFDFEKFANSEEFVTCQLFYANKTYAGLGQVMSNSLDDSTGAAMSATAVWVGEAKAAA